MSSADKLLNVLRHWRSQAKFKSSRSQALVSAAQLLRAVRHSSNMAVRQVAITNRYDLHAVLPHREEADLQCLTQVPYHQVYLEPVISSQLFDDAKGCLLVMMLRSYKNVVSPVGSCEYFISTTKTNQYNKITTYDDISGHSSPNQPQNLKYHL